MVRLPAVRRVTGKTVVCRHHAQPSARSITASAGDFATTLSGAVLGSGNTRATLTLGLVTNADTSPGDESIDLTFTAVVTNSAGNQSGTILRGAVDVNYDGATTTAFAPTLSGRRATGHGAAHGARRPSAALATRVR